MSTTAFIDFFTGIDKSFNPDKLNYPDVGLPHLWTNERGTSGYDTAQRHETTGLIRAWNSRRRDMGLMYRASGKALQALSDMTAMSRSKSLLMVGLGELKCTRIDLAIDVLMPEGELGRLAKEAGKLNRSRERNKFTIIGEAGTSKGMTIYRGSRTSQKFIRYYDSALLHGLPEGTIRMELELKGETASEAWRLIRALVSPSEWIKGILAWVNEFPSLEATLGDPQELEPLYTSYIEGDTWEWLKKQVAPTLKRDIISFASERLLQRLIAEVLSGFGEYPDGIVEALDTLTTRYLSELDL